MTNYRDNYVVPGMNVVICPACGSRKKKGGRVFVPIPLTVYERFRIDGGGTARGTCHRCKIWFDIKFVHPLAPANEPDQDTKERIAQMLGRAK